jgi:hypothetical protein
VDRLEYGVAVLAAVNSFFGASDSVGKIIPGKSAADYSCLDRRGEYCALLSSVCRIATGSGNSVAAGNHGTVTDDAEANTMTGRIFFGFFFLAIGISAMTGIDIFRFVIPLFFIFIGIRILTGRGRFRSRINTSELRDDSINEVAVFSGSEKRVISTDFSGGKAVCIFSSMEIDLTGVKTKSKNLELELVSVFGGLKLIVPQSWRVTTEGADIMGGFANRTAGGADTAPKLHVKGAAVFGGVDIVN